MVQPIGVPDSDEAVRLIDAPQLVEAVQLDLGSWKGATTTELEMTRAPGARSRLSCASIELRIGNLFLCAREFVV